jgi:flavin-dependent dehydrogenase
MKYQVGIIGAGLAGLSLAIQISRQGYSVVLFEKSTFPFHKLCGEYLSRESLPFLEYLGFNYESFGPAEINQLKISNASGKELKADLPLGGIGLSRWSMDQKLAQIAVENGTTLLENTLVKSTKYIDNEHIVSTRKGDFVCGILISAFGKKSNLINKVKTDGQNSNDYIGIKYHARLDSYPEDLISIHNFKDGYCGVCRLEEDWVSVCYLSHTQNLKNSGNSIADMQEQVLFKNINIREVFENAEFLYEKPLTVSNISFKKKHLVKDDIIYVGDAAGLITPLCGNGMSMSLHASAILGPLVLKNLKGEISKSVLFTSYQNDWKKQFRTRMAVGRSIQKMFRSERTADLGLTLLNKVPIFNKKIISLTHGKAFHIVG